MFPIIKRTKYHKSIAFLTKVLQQNEGSTENLTIFNKSFKLISICGKLMILVYSFAIIFVCTIPLILYIVCGIEWEPALPMYLPGTSRESIDDYCLNIVYQILLLIYSGVAYCSFDLLLIFQILHITLLTNILMNKMRYVSDLVGNEQPRRQLELMRNLRNIVLLHNEMLEYVKNLQNIYSPPIAMVVLLAAGSIGKKIFASITVIYTELGSRTAFQID